MKYLSILILSMVLLGNSAGGMAGLGALVIAGIIGLAAIIASIYGIVKFFLK
tara:strand:+ start:171 stop:326 length:156 start_codon:yes stop_codon:yes gene_type:complete